MGRKNEGKTETIKSRRAPVYIPDMKTKEKWQELAKKRGKSLSGFMLDAVEFYVEQIESNRLEKARDIEKIERNTEELQKELEKLRKLVSGLEYELNLCRKNSESTKKVAVESIDSELISVLKKGPISTEEILTHLGIRMDDAEGKANVARQLHLLLDTGFIRYLGKVWIWVE